MSLNYPTVGENYSPAYQVSAVPFVKSESITGGQIKKISLDYVARFFTLKNTGSGTISFGFSAEGVAGSDKFTLKTDESYIGELRVTEIFVTASANSSFTFLAGLTSIPARNLASYTNSFGTVTAVP
jgi:hypothetical protein